MPVCQFIKPKYTRPQDASGMTLWNLLQSRPDIPGQHILLVEGLVHRA
jgi:hypothetical protein